MNDGPGDVAPAGWYVDPKTSLHLRWWSGREWTGHIAPLPDLGHPAVDSSRDVPPTTGSVASAAPPRSRPAPERALDTARHGDREAGGTAVNGADVMAGPDDAERYRALAGHSSTTAVWLIAFTPWLTLLAVAAALFMYPWGLREWFQYAAVALPWLVTIACAERDAKRLRRRGHAPVASVAWSLLGAPAYLIARTVVLRRTSGIGAGPLWLWLANLLAVTGTGLLLISLGHHLAAAAGR